MPNASVLGVLTEEVNSPAYTGLYSVDPPFGPAWEFGYTVIKVWEASTGALLAGPLALAPLTPVANINSTPCPTLSATWRSERARRLIPTQPPG